jgi:hypothetical protein
MWHTSNNKLEVVEWWAVRQKGGRWWSRRGYNRHDLPDSVNSVNSANSGHSVHSVNSLRGKRAARRHRHVKSNTNTGG